MGVGFYQPLSQWSKGQYAGASNLEDDYRVMSDHGLKLRADEDNNEETTSRTLTASKSIGGIISNPEDIDYFQFTPTTTEDYSIAVDGATFSPDLDLRLSLYPQKKAAEKIVVNPPLTIENADIARGLSARTVMKLTKGVSYIFTVEGVGLILNNDIAYTNYGSIGTYKITLSLSGSASNTTKKTSTAQTSPISGANESSSNAVNGALPDKLVLPIVNADGTQAMVLPTLKTEQERFGKRWIHNQ
jgi:hypothetical protein